VNGAIEVDDDARFDRGDFNGPQWTVLTALPCVFVCVCPRDVGKMLLSPLLNRENVLFGAEILGVAFVLYCLGCAVYNRYFHPYKDFPGPFWASITPLWYFRAVRYARGQDHQLPLHKRYGPFVRISPDQIQIMDPAAIETVVCAARGPCAGDC
jgi:hypothetical protein